MYRQNHKILRTRTNHDVSPSTRVLCEIFLYDVKMFCSSKERLGETNASKKCTTTLNNLKDKGKQFL